MQRPVWAAANTCCCGAMAAISPATFRCIQRLADGDSVASACHAALDVDNDFDLEPCLRDLFAQGLIVAFIDEGGAT